MGAPRKRKDELSVIHARVDRLLAEEVRKAAIAERVSVRFLVEKSLRDLIVIRQGLHRLLPVGSSATETVGGAPEAAEGGVNPGPDSGP